MSKLALAAIGLALAGTPALAQHAQPYAGLQDRPIKALSEQQVADLRAGRGMGLALAAELNGYPGPLHTVELADRLALSPEQVAVLNSLMARMKTEAVALGEDLLRQEAGLDGLFAGGSVTGDSLAAATRKIGNTQADLRNAHLKYHLATRDLLTPEQVKRYGEFRGYVAAARPVHQHN